MSFFSYTSQTPIIENVFGIEEPDLSYAKSVSVESLDLILVPLVAFDKDCNRIGMGEGYYDKALSDLNNSNKKRTHLMGVAYNFQKVEQIKPNKWDVPLDCIVTEIDVYRS
jgi:5-formyltetrahydrofolate cyclo-ligase